MPCVGSKVPFGLVSGQHRFILPSSELGYLPDHALCRTSTADLPEGSNYMERHRIQREASVYFITYSVVDWLPVFVSEPSCRIITDALNYCHQHKSLRTNCYVIMPTHMHAIFFDERFDPQRLIQSLADFRRFTGRALSDFCAQHMPPCFIERLRTASAADRNRRFWQPGRHPEAIVTEKFWKQKVNYIHDNPCRKGLVMMPHHWRFSSAGCYNTEGRTNGDVPISALDWG